MSSDVKEDHPRPNFEGMLHVFLFHVITGVANILRP